MHAVLDVLLVGLVEVCAIQGIHPPTEPPGEPLALAQIRREPLDAGPEERGGDASNLPVGCRYSPEELVHWARNNMPEVRSAMDEFNRRGYVAVPAADTAVSGCAQGIPASGVTLAFMKPGAFIDSAHVVAPMILVTTKLHPLTGEPYTVVSGGLVVGDGAASLVYSGDSLDTFRHSDPSFDIRRVGGGGGGPRREPAGIERWGDYYDTFFNPNSRFNRFLGCAGWSTISCIVAAIRLGPNFTPLKIAVILGEPHVGLAILGGCALASALGCVPYLY